MYRFGKVCFYTIISIIVSITIYLGTNQFFDVFLNNLVPLLATLSALYMTANSIIAVEINKLKRENPSADTGKTMKSIKKIFITQLVLIIALVLSLILKDLLLSIKCESKYFQGIVIVFSNAFAIAVFGYFLEAIYDMGQTLFTLIDFNNRDKD